jgi:hypothetical protein
MNARFLRICVLFAMAVAALIGSGCAGTKPKPPATVVKQELEGAPCWVAKGGGCYFKNDAERAKYICGVGLVGGTRNVGLAREAAMGRGRTEIARSLAVRVTSMLKDYQATTTGGVEFGTSAADEQHIVDVSKQITDMTLSGTEIVDSWISDSGTYYALCRLNVDGFKDTVRRMTALSESVRQAVVDRADQAFEELDRATNGQADSK